MCMAVIVSFLAITGQLADICYKILHRMALCSAQIVCAECLPDALLQLPKIHTFTSAINWQVVVRKRLLG